MHFIKFVSSKMREVLICDLSNCAVENKEGELKLLNYECHELMEEKRVFQVFNVSQQSLFDFFARH